MTVLNTEMEARAEQLRLFFALMVPHFIINLQREGVDVLAEAQRLNRDEAFMHRIIHCEEMLFGTFAADSHQSKTAYAQVIAVLSFAPGGVRAFGLHFEAARGPWYSARITGENREALYTSSPAWKGAP